MNDRPSASEPETKQNHTSPFHRYFVRGLSAVVVAALLNGSLLAMIAIANKQPEPERKPAPNEWTLRRVQMPPSKNQNQMKKQTQQNDPDPRALETEINFDPVNQNNRREPSNTDSTDLSSKLPTTNIQHKIHGPVQLNRSALGNESISTGFAQSPSNNQSPPGGEGKLDTMPRRTSGSPPAYPAEARQQTIEGTVLLELDLDRNGTVTRVKVLEWSGTESFVEAARQAVRDWTFSPGLKNGEPVPVHGLQQRIRFRLQ